MIFDIITITVSLFAIINPFGSIPIFLLLFGKDKRRKTTKAALEISLAAFILLLVFSLGGLALFSTLGISLPAFMIAGGILLLILSFDLIHGELPRSRRIDTKISDAIVPIGTPLLAGPGAITSSIYFTQQTGFPTVLVSLLIVFVASFICLFSSRIISRVLGSSGLKILTRIMGLITAAIAISLIEKAFVMYGLIQI